MKKNFSKVFFNDEKLLFSLNVNIISHINKILGIKKEIKISTIKIKHEKYDSKLLNIKKHFCYSVPKYNQVFMSKFNFIPNLSILDLLFNLGPQSLNYLSNLNFNQFHNE